MLCITVADNEGTTRAEAGAGTRGGGAMRTNPGKTIRLAVKRLCLAPAALMDIKICCIKLSLAARFIAMLGLIVSVLVLTQLSTELAEQDGSRGTVSILLGLDIDEFTSDKSKSQLGNEIMIGFLLFSLVYAVASAILIWGTIVEQSWCALPWLICEAMSFAIQIATVTIHGMTLKTNKDKWIVIFTTIHLLLSMYFWIVVFSAQYAWSRQKREAKENETTSTTSSGNETIQDEVFESSAPPSPQKYIQV